MNITVTAHQSHWYDIIESILRTLAAVNPIIATFIPAPIEAGIVIATTVEPIVVGAITGK